MSDDRAETRVPLSAFREALKKGLDGADPFRTQALTGLRRLRVVKANIMAREEASLAKSLPPDHPSRVDLGKRLGLNEGLVRDLAVEIKRSQLAVPTVDEKTWVLHGYVRRRDLSGVPNLTVALYDQKGKRLQQLSYACTDPEGYFKLSYVSEPASPKREFLAAAEKAMVRVFIHVLDKRQGQVYVDKRPLAPSLGRVDYREIFIPNGSEGCAPPEPEPED